MKRDWHGRFIKGHLGFNKGKRLVKYKKIICPVCKVEFEIREKSNRKFCNKKICIYKGRIRKEEWLEILKGRVIENEKKKVDTIILIHPAMMEALDNFELFKKVVEFLSKYKTAKISEFKLK